jgi:hypothetical protein
VISLPLLVIAVSATVVGCGQPEPGQKANWTLMPVVVWASDEADATHLPDGVPVRRALPSAPQAIAWGNDADLWATFDEAVGRIPDAVTATRIDLIDPPPDEGVEDSFLEPSQVLAPGGPGGRVAVGLWNGLVAVLTPGDQPNWSLLPVREEPYGAGIMPLVRWTSFGALAIHVHLTCDMAVLDPETGADVWRRTDGAARYPGMSANGKYLLLPWEAGIAAEVLDAATGNSLASLPPAEKGRVYGAIDDSGQWVVLGRYEDSLTIWDVTLGKTSQVQMEGEGAVPVGLAFLPGTTTCAVSGPRTVRLLDVPTRQWLTRWTLPGGSQIFTFLPQGDLAVSPDGRYIAVRASGPTIYVLAAKFPPSRFDEP